MGLEKSHDYQSESWGASQRWWLCVEHISQYIQQLLSNFETTNIRLVGQVLEGKSGDHQSGEDSSPGDRKCLHDIQPRCFPWRGCEERRSRSHYILINRMNTITTWKQKQNRISPLVSQSQTDHFLTDEGPAYKGKAWMCERKEN